MRYTDQDLKNLALEFYKKYQRPPRMREIQEWRTIVRRWKDRGSWVGFLKDTELPTYEEWEYDMRIKAINDVLKNHGEIPQKEYNMLVKNKAYPYLPDILTLNRMFGTCELGTNGKVWSIAQNIKDEGE